MPVHSLLLAIEKSLDPEGPGVEVVRVLWRKPDRPSRPYFYEVIEQGYESIEMPWFPSRTWIEVETDTEIHTVDCDRPVDEPGLVALALWAEIARIGSGL